MCSPESCLKCNQGRECKRRETRAVEAWVLFAAILAAAIAAAAAVVFR